MERRRQRGTRLASLVLGALLIVGGIALLAAQYYGIDVRFNLADYGWPLFVIVPGLALLVIGLLTDDDPGVGLAIAGSIVTTVGLILSYQRVTDHWASWAYAWTLIAPTAVGVGMSLWGALHMRWRVLRGGLGAVAVGLVIFLIFFGFFEGLLNIGGERGLAPLGRSALPVALIVAGVLVILGRLWPRRSPPARPDTWMGARPVVAHGPQEAAAAPPAAAEAGPAPTATAETGPAPQASVPAGSEPAAADEPAVGRWDTDQPPVRRWGTDQRPGAYPAGGPGDAGYTGAGGTVDDPATPEQERRTDS